MLKICKNSVAVERMDYLVNYFETLKENVRNDMIQYEVFNLYSFRCDIRFVYNMCN